MAALRLNDGRVVPVRQQALKTNRHVLTRQQTAVFVTFI